MSAAVAQRNTHHLGPQPPSRTNSPMDNKRTAIKTEGKQTKGSPKITNGDATAKKSNVPTIVNSDAATDSKPSTTNADGAAPLAPPPKPSTNEGGDYFSSNHQTNNPSFGEQNPFDSAFGSTQKLPETPGGTQLPPVASLTSPAGQLTGNSNGTFNWGNSLRSGPLSPAMLSGPAGEDYFSTNVGLARGFPTPNESSLRTGLTPGGGGSMFPPAPSPNTQAIFSQLGGFQTPGTLDFHRTAMNANGKKDPFTAAPNSQAPTTQAPTATADNTTATANNQNFDQHDAANGLFMLAQAGTESQANNNFALQNQATQEKRNNARVNTGSVSNVSDGTVGRSTAPSEEAEQKPNMRNKNKKGSSTKSSRKADDAPPKQPAKKKGKGNNGQAQSANQFEQDDMSDDDDDDIDLSDGPDDGREKDPKKMTDEEKRKNFLERNRVAALKCRQRKKQWLANLQAKVEIYTSENDALTAQVTQLREEILNLKTILIAHKDCPIAQQQTNMGQYIPTQHPDYGGHPGAYGQFGPPGPGQMPNMAGGPRRYS